MTTRKSTTKPKRVPVSGARDILNVNDMKETHKYRWVNDIDNRIQRFQDAGYQFVTADGKLEDDRPIAGEESLHNTSTRSKGVVFKNVGKGTVSYLMAIPKEYYKDDQDAKQERIDKTESALRNASGQDGRYGDVDISRDKRIGKL
jgi:hypothetical protein